MIWIVFALLFYIFQIGTILIIEFRNPAKAMAWLTILFFFPIIGFVLYYFMAKNYTNRRKVKRKGRKIMREIRKDFLKQSEQWKQMEQSHVLHGTVKLDIQDNHRLYGLLNNLPGSPISKNNITKVLTNGTETYDALMKAMEAAVDHIHLEFYTIRHDGIGRKFQQLMIKKAKAGVQVRLLFDGIGSYGLSSRFLGELHQAGVETSCFFPPLIAFVDKRLNYRNHRRIVVVDGVIGFLGGINIGDEYLGGNPTLGFWRDTHMQIQGDAVYHLQKTFLKDWSLSTGKPISDARYFPEQEVEGEETVQIVVSGPDAHWDTILEVFFSAISTAQHRVYITTPYFIPDISISMALKTAAISGVDVRIICPSVSDSRIVHWACLSYMEELMQAGVRFFQYQKGFVHAKIMLTDHTIATVGTANMDMRSFFSNFELNAVMFDRGVMDRLEKDFLRDLKDCKELLLPEFEKRSRLHKALEVIARMLSPLF